MSCPFCMIADSIPPATEPKVLTTPLGSAYPVLSTAIVIAFLDIAPVTPGHILLCPRRHCEKATDMTVAEAAALGVWLPILTRALLKVLGTTTEEAGWNIIQANGSEAGQTVPHSHFHIIPRLGGPRGATDISDAERKNLALGEGPRIKLDHEEGTQLCIAIQFALRQEIRKLQAGKELGGPDEELFVNLHGHGLEL
ncbi:HIT-like protein [Hyaloscypha bicolor E]|uniref:HIT-like protein n=1 Tax=Hyaloscypha bicolor E TaxID=1095630 RepID=A0A2J6TLB4_9HELO|nr:HIT-like protein [Hyaloscypha bicolor E]PMD63804.1 HIT-like protein [Hyaloscypha bicolor E]